MTKGPTSAKSPPTLPSLKAFLQPAGRLSEARFSEESQSSREDTLAARSVARFAASFGVDTRLGISCFSLHPETSAVALDLERLRVAILACNPEKHRKFTLDCKRLLQERLLEGKKEMPLTQRDLVNLRLCANSQYDVNKELPEGLGRPHGATKKPRDIFAVLKAQAGPLGSAWGDTTLGDDDAALSCLSDVLSAVLGAEVPRPLNCHVQLGLRPTEQRLRTRGEYLEDSAQVGTAVEETEFSVGGAYVPRPPPLVSPKSRD